MTETVRTSPVSRSQDQQHGTGHDYEHGSPHLTHLDLRTAVLERVRHLVAEQLDRSGTCRVLEIGAGHGAVTDHVIAMGADVTVTEMSRASLAVLRTRYRANPRVRLLLDPDGEAVFADGGHYDLVLAVSVLHHVPDYLGFVGRLCGLVDAGGALATFQDPLWYPRRGRLGVRVSRAMYLAWRVAQGDLRRGVATQVRRVRGVYDDSNPSDLVEYHVVRNGVDEEALRDVLAAGFDDVAVWPYFSTQSPTLHRLGTRLGMTSDFGIVARGRRG